MIIKIGTDICSVERVTKAYERFGIRFCQKTLTQAEIAYVTSRKVHMYERLAARLAAKEATVKALGTGWHGVGWKEVEIVRSPSGEPGLKLHGRAALVADRLGLDYFQVTMSHERQFATAFVLATGQR